MRQRSKSLFEEPVSAGTKDDETFSDTDERPDDDVLGAYSWSENDISELVSRVEGASLPNTMVFWRALQVVNWEQIAFNGHSGKDCLDQLKKMLKPVRLYRTASELMADVKINIEKNVYSAKAKRPLNPYMIYLIKNKTKLNEYRKKHPDSGNLLKTACTFFSKLSKSEKQIYIDESQQLKKINSDMKRELGMAKKKAKEAEKLVELSPTRLYFKNEDPDEKLTWGEKIKMFSKLKSTVRLQWVLKALKKNGKLASPFPLKELFFKSEKALLDRYEDKPIEPKLKTAYASFCDKTVKNPEYKHLSPTERLRKAESGWEALSEKDRKKLQKKVDKTLANYETAMREYLRKLPSYRRDEIASDSAAVADQSQSSEVCNESQDITDASDSIVKQNGKKRKLSVPSDAEQTQPEIKKKGKKTKATTEPDEKPAEPEPCPNNVFEFYAKSIFRGSEKNAKKAFGNLSSAKRKQVDDKFKEVTQKYLTDLEKYLASLSTSEMSKFMKKMSKKNNKKEGSIKSEEEEEDEEDEDNENEDEEENENDDVDHKESGEDDDEEEEEVVKEEEEEDKEENGSDGRSSSGSSL